MGGAVADGVFITSETDRRVHAVTGCARRPHRRGLGSNPANGNVDAPSLSGDLVLVRTGTSVIGLDIQDGETVFDSGPLTGQFDYRSGGVAVAGGRLLRGRTGRHDPGLRPAVIGGDALSDR